MEVSPSASNCSWLKFIGQQFNEPISSPFTLQPSPRTPFRSWFFSTRAQLTELVRQYFWCLCMCFRFIEIRKKLRTNGRKSYTSLGHARTMSRKHTLEGDDMLGTGQRQKTDANNASVGHCPSRCLVVSCLCTLSLSLPRCLSVSRCLSGCLSGCLSRSL